MAPLRRAHSEEMLTEVNVQTSSTGKSGQNSSSEIKDSNNNNKNLRVSDTPMNTASDSSGLNSRKRIRRNSAGDEINSILNHETSHILNSGPQLMMTFNSTSNSDADRHSSMTSSSLNTTVITKIDASERLNMDPEDHLDFLHQENNERQIHNKNRLIRPIPGKPMQPNDQSSLPPLPGPKPKYYQNNMTWQQQGYYQQQQQQPQPQPHLNHQQINNFNLTNNNNNHQGYMNTMRSTTSMKPMCKFFYRIHQSFMMY